MFDMFISAFSSACSMEALVANFIGVALGIVFGALPGLTAVMGVALLIPLTFGFPAVIAFSGFTRNDGRITPSAATTRSCTRMGDATHWIPGSTSPYS